MYMEKSIIKIILNYYNQLIISTLIIIINNIILDFSRTLILTKLIEKVLIFFIILLLSGILSRVHLIKQIMVCHTFYCQKLKELFTLSSELPFLADLVF